MMIQHVLALDIAGNPFEWLSPEDAVSFYAKGKVAWELGDTEMVFRGGFSNLGVQSMIAVRPIIAISGSEAMVSKVRWELPLGQRDNDLLFKRDAMTCVWCAGVFPRHMLTREHLVPRSKGGPDTWMNCATACSDCNQAKGSKMPHEFGPLVYLPYVPNRAEHFILSGRNVLADQHDYLAARLPRHSRLLVN